MSFDAEVEKNKKLTRIIEDLRYKKQELKNTLAKMQKAAGKHTNYKDDRWDPSHLMYRKSQLKKNKVRFMRSYKQSYHNVQVFLKSQISTFLLTCYLKKNRNVLFKIQTSSSICLLHQIIYLKSYFNLGIIFTFSLFILYKIIE